MIKFVIQFQPNELHIKQSIIQKFNRIGNTSCSTYRIWCPRTASCFNRQEACDSSLPACIHSSPYQWITDRFKWVATNPPGCAGVKCMENVHLDLNCFGAFYSESEMKLGNKHHSTL